MNTSHHSPPDPDPAPRRASGPGPGGGVPPGETPPGESSMSEAGPRETHNPTKGWAKGPLIAIWLVVALFAVFLLAMAVSLWTS
ncbi:MULTISPECIES: DUF6480 family protein [Streptomyces]|uniref:Uncharacterized protein n=1 Tax=Streptomyces lycii TaxID=2654337 RepID=A0ABQ7FRH3_9ACTN|nr:MULTISPECIES: DUF6480 family protein [Streptomyces]KAF4410788.1 hypothetical protein GCU69_01875 [Streptomyces lycii]PGH47826.1 hypothetical protein CRI70_26385 [Streptomyces sp. Ru87]